MYVCMYVMVYVTAWPLRKAKKVPADYYFFSRVFVFQALFQVRSGVLSCVRRRVCWEFLLQKMCVLFRGRCVFVRRFFSAAHRTAQQRKRVAGTRARRARCRREPLRVL